MATPATIDPSPEKPKPLLDGRSDLGPCEDSPAMVEAIPSDQTNVSSPPENTCLESIMSVEQDMTNEDREALVKTEKLEMVAAGDSHQGQDQVPEEWEDLEKYVIVIRSHGSGGRRSFQCSLCGKVMNKSLPLTMAHIEAKHFRELFTHTCDVCQETFKTKAILMSHIKRIHKDQTL